MAWQRDELAADMFKLIFVRMERLQEEIVRLREENKSLRAMIPKQPDLECHLTETDKVLLAFAKEFPDGFTTTQIINHVLCHNPTFSEHTLRYRIDKLKKHGYITKAGIQGRPGRGPKFHWLMLNSREGVK